MEDAKKFFEESYGNFKYPFRLGRKQKRAILDAEGKEVVILDRGRERLAERITELLNIDWLLYHSK